MASARKPYNPPGRQRNETKAHQYASFVADLLDGTVRATAVHEVIVNQRVRLEYDDPNG